MGRRVSIPVRVVRPERDPYRRASLAREMEELASSAGLRRAQAEPERKPPADVPPEEGPVEPVAAPGPAKQVETIEAPLQAGAPRAGAPQAALPKAGKQTEAEEWRSQALRLQAEMDNFRKRQQRLAQDQVQAERQRLLNGFLGIVDDLERALAVPDGGAEGMGDGEGVRRGVELTHRTALHLLEKEGVERMQVEGEVFDPNWHEAVATTGRDGDAVAANSVVANRVIQVLEPGYRLDGRLLRPARVVVAV